MIKKIAAWILKREMQFAIDVREEVIEYKEKEINRLQATVNALQEDNRRLRDGGFIRQFKLTPQKLTPDEQKIIGKYVETPILDLLTKWFEEKADENNQLLLHSKDESETKKELWKLATLVYEDWMMLIQHCKGAYKREESKKDK